MFCVSRRIDKKLPSGSIQETFFREEKLDKNLLISKETGLPRFGYFNEIINKINCEDFKYKSPLGKQKGKLAKKIDFKEFQFIGLLSEDLILGCAIADIKYASNAFIYFYDPKNKDFEEFSFLNPFAIKTKLSSCPHEGKSYFYKGKNSIEIIPAGPLKRLLNVQLKNGQKVQLTLTENKGSSPLRVCTKTGATGWTYTEKSNGLSVSGTVYWKGVTRKIEGDKYAANVDISMGYMRRETYWNWASFSGFVDIGPVKEKIGLNLASGVNETSYSENCFWVGQKKIHLNGACFSFDRENPRSRWFIKTQDNAIDLEFVPDEERSEKINLFFLASNFKQMIGKFYGVIKDGEQEININGLWGFTEDHFAKW